MTNVMPVLMFCQFKVTIKVSFSDGDKTKKIFGIYFDIFKIKVISTVMESTDSIFLCFVSSK